MDDIAFKGWPKIKRDNPFKVTITEKLNGTNACIIIGAFPDIGNQVIGIQSRNRLITKEDDNFGFARWVMDNEPELATMGEGYHYGEWCGPGIQKNPHKFEDKGFYLFDVLRWNEDNPNLPECCNTVPIRYQGNLMPMIIPNILEALASQAIERMKGEVPEGIVVFYHAFRTRTKHTIDSPDGKWACKE